MSTLWTPSGERPIPRKDDPAAGGAPGGAPAGEAPSEEQVQAEMAELQARLARTPAALVIANHAFGLFELAALHLSLDPPQLDQARLAIDALATLVEGLGERLGPQATELSAGLGQIRMAYVQISGASQGTRPAGEPAADKGGGGAASGVDAGGGGAGEGQSSS